MNSTDTLILNFTDEGLKREKSYMLHRWSDGRDQPRISVLQKAKRIRGIQRCGDHKREHDRI